VVTGACLLLGGRAVLGMGDRFAWSPALEETEETETDEVVRTVRKVEEAEEQVEGRFVGKEVLCSLGLADVSISKDDTARGRLTPLCPVLPQAVRCRHPVRAAGEGDPLRRASAGGAGRRTVLNPGGEGRHRQAGRGRLRSPLLWSTQAILRSPKTILRSSRSILRSSCSVLRSPQALLWSS
jgi:hypothetical protein